MAITTIHMCIFNTTLHVNVVSVRMAHPPVSIAGANPIRQVERVKTAAVVQIDAGLAGSGTYRLDVIAPSIPEAVSHLGGWIFDRAMAGWKVTIVVPDADHRGYLSARVLGAEVADYDAIRCPHRPRPYGIAVVGAARYHDGVQAYIERTSTSGHLEVSIAEASGGSAELSGSESRRHQHHLSRAAAAFKSRSLIMVGATSGPQNSDVEWLTCAIRGHTGGGGRCVTLGPGEVAAPSPGGPAADGDVGSVGRISGGAHWGSRYGMRLLE